MTNLKWKKIPGDIAYEVKVGRLGKVRVTRLQKRGSSGSKISGHYWNILYNPDIPAVDEMWWERGDLSSKKIMVIAEKYVESYLRAEKIKIDSLSDRLYKVIFKFKHPS